MTPLPSFFPSDAVSILVTAIKASDYTSSDTVTAAWNLVGYGAYLGFGRVVAAGGPSEIDDIPDHQALALLESIQAGHESKLAGADPTADPSEAINPATIFALVKWALKIILLLPI